MLLALYASAEDSYEVTACGIRLVSNIASNSAWFFTLDFNVSSIESKFFVVASSSYFLLILVFREDLSSESLPQNQRGTDISKLTIWDSSGAPDSLPWYLRLKIWCVLPFRQTMLIVRLFNFILLLLNSGGFMSFNICRIQFIQRYTGN